ncbi:hypothetical protein [Trichococcus alkaliphilus]|uniref:hypothetical protein n=1 Tax=Trichococcus alkaliphilus TaxID=2052943 RepID=UPI000D0AF7D1|nr:hypothetical protein [Trichococcus alkaliphilus]
MEKRKFKWRPLLISLPILFFTSFGDQAGTFYTLQIQIFLILLISILLGFKKRASDFMLENPVSTMLFVSGILNVFAAPGTIATNLLASDPLALLGSFSLKLLVYAVFSLFKIFTGIYKDLDEENNPKKDKTKKFISNFAVIAVSYFANIGLYILINKGVRMVVTSDFDLSATDPSLRGTFEDLNMWGNWHYQADVFMFVGLIFIALAFVSIPVYKLVVGYRSKT